MGASRKDRLVREIAAQCNVEIGAIEDAYPCTAMQRGAVVASVASPGMLFSHFAYRLGPEVSADLDRFRQCLQLVWDRTPILRSRVVCIETDDGQERHIQAVIRQGIEWAEFVDLDVYKTKISQRPLEYGDPLARFAFSRDEEYLVLTLHHSLYDAWSLSLLWSDIAVAWEAGGKEDAIKCRTPFSKFSAFLQLGMDEATSMFWAEQLKNYQGPSYALRADPGCPVPGPDTNVLLSGEFELAWAGGNAISATVRARVAWAMTLMELFGSDDILFLEITSGRNCPVDGIEDMIGPTITTIPVRLRRSVHGDLRSFLQAAQQENGQLLRHEHGHAAAYEAHIPDRQKPRHILNVMNKMQRQQLSDQSPAARIGLEDITDVSSQKNSADWGMNLETHSGKVVWSFYADDRILPQQSIEFLTTRFPVRMEECAKVTEL